MDGNSPGITELSGAFEMWLKRDKPELPRTALCNCARLCDREGTTKSLLSICVKLFKVRLMVLGLYCFAVSIALRVLWGTMTNDMR